MTTTTDTEKDTIATEIAFALCASIDGNWTMHPSPWGRELRHAHDYGVHLSWRDGRIHVSGIWPKTADGAVQNPPSYVGTAPSISVSPTKTPAQIAGDITRRFLPAYLPLYQTMRQRATEQDSHEEQTAATLRALRKANGEPDITRNRDDRHGDKIYLRESHAYTLTASGTSVRFESFSCPIAVALQLLPLLVKPTPDTD